MNENSMTATSLTEATVELEKTVEFIRSVGIPVHFRSLGEDCFLPGIRIEGAAIVVDPEKLKYPGDILHEAGHIAVVPAAERDVLTENSIAEREMREAEEMMAIAWSYAASVHLGLDAEFVFHQYGYKGGGNNIADNFKQGHYFGVPMLQWVGMALEKKDAANPDLPVYPAMLKWLRD